MWSHRTALAPERQKCNLKPKIAGVSILIIFEKKTAIMYLYLADNRLRLLNRISNFFFQQFFFVIWFTDSIHNWSMVCQLLNLIFPTMQLIYLDVKRQKNYCVHVVVLIGAKAIP